MLRLSRLQSMDRSLSPPLLQNPACAFPRTRLLSEVPVVTGTRPAKKSPVELMIWGLAPSHCWASLPHATAWVLAHGQRYCPRSPPPHRPHVSVSEAFPSALASCGILPDMPCGWHLLTTPRESTCRVTPFPVPMARIRRAVLSTGLLGSADRSVSKAAGAVSCAILAPARQPLALVRVHDGSTTPLLALPIDACETGYPE
jgi:hypothetical protein